ncbi:hypothetical protein [Pontimicrobium aquaticum]|uniref:Uncharacterized protein n=1 Tax=Pontimicrobium aquaticum TaxID=2565367 RepID=A0A4U0ESR0_9FLAO|nr:hypothetical protein [Pontimicrobium aquaticum]TJY34638.1 hypothetical protein E5167_10020 [Pontimicrobium aquaticum]
MKKNKNKQPEIDTYNEFIKNYYNESSKVESYSRNRIDYLTITLSTGGIVFGATILKFIFENQLDIETSLVKASMVFFIITIVLNFINQHFAVKVHQNEKEWAQKEQEIIRYESKEENKINRMKILNSAITWLNLGALVTLFVGLITISIFLLTTF